MRYYYTFSINIVQLADTTRSCHDFISKKVWSKKNVMVAISKIISKKDVLFTKKLRQQNAIYPSIKV